MQVLIADCTITWRLWVIWSDIRVIAIPVLLLLAQLGAGIALVVLEIIRIVGPWTPFRNDQYLSAWIVMVYTSMVCNFMVIGLIIFRLWKVDRDTKQHRGLHGGTRYGRIIMVLIESGAIYIVFTVAYLIANYAGNVGHPIFFL